MTENEKCKEIEKLENKIFCTMTRSRFLEKLDYSDGCSVLLYLIESISAKIISFVCSPLNEESVVLAFEINQILHKEISRDLEIIIEKIKKRENKYERN